MNQLTNKNEPLLLDGRVVAEQIRNSLKVRIIKPLEKENNRWRSEFNPREIKMICLEVKYEHATTSY